MRKAIQSGVILVAAAAAMTAVPAVAWDGSSSGSYDRDDRDDRDDQDDNLTVIGLAGDGTRLVRFSTESPERTRNVGTVTLTEDARLVGIDFRVQNSALYGVGNAGGLYRIDATNAAATKVGQLTTALAGTAFGVDFNPAANALRVISNTGQNLRQPFATLDDGIAGNQAATAVDGTLNYPGGQATPVAGLAAQGVTGAAYTNNDLSTTTGTTLYDLDTTLDQSALQSPANSGFLAATGSLQNDFVGDTGFDIYSKVRDGRAVELFPYAVNAGRLFDVTLFNGAAEDEGRIGDGTIVVTDLAIPLNQL